QGRIQKRIQKRRHQHPVQRQNPSVCGWCIDYGQPMTVIANPEDSRTPKEDLASIGFDKLKPNVHADKADKYFDDSYENVSPEDLVKNYEDKHILDVRSTSEYKEGNVENAHHVHFGHLDEKEVPFSTDDTIYVHCQSGVRSAIA